MNKIEFPMGLSDALKTIRAMVNNFVNHHDIEWEKYKEEHAYGGELFISFQSYIGTDLLIDIIYLVEQWEKGEPFTQEYWIRSQGTHCVKNAEEAEAVRKAFGSDILAKIKVCFDGEKFTNIEWIYDKDCVIKNKFLEDKEFYQYIW